MELAEELYWKSIEEAKLFGEFDPRLAASLNNLAVVLRTRGRFQEVEDLYNLALRIWKMIDDEHECMAMCLNNAGGFYLIMGRYAEARQLYRRALKLFEDRERAEDYLLAACLSNLGHLHVVRGKPTQAEGLYKRSRKVAEALLGEEHPCVALVLSGMGEMYTAQQRYSRAGKLLERAREILERTQGPSHPDYATCLVRLGDLKFSRREASRRLARAEEGSAEEVEDCYRRALVARQSRLGADHPESAHILRKIAHLEVSRKHHDRAEDQLRRALSIYLESYGPYHLEVANCLDECAVLMRKLGRLEEARRLDERCATVRTRQRELEGQTISVLTYPADPG